jgi:hypothetical protein
MSNRDDKSRSAATKGREVDETKVMERPAMDRWSPAAVLEMPKIAGEFRLRWIAEHVNGIHVPRNVQSALKEGYARVNMSEFLEEFVCDEDTDGRGYARNGGFILMKLPEAFAQQREAHYARKSKEGLNGANVLQGVAGSNAVFEDRGTKTLSGADAGAAMQQMSRQ